MTSYHDFWFLHIEIWDINMRDLLGHPSSTECLEEITLLNVISHSSTPQAEAPSFFIKITSVDFIDGKYFPPQSFPIKFWSLVHPAGLQCPPSSTIILSHLTNHFVQSCNWIVNTGDLSTCLSITPFSFAVLLWFLPICSTCVWWETLKCTQQIKVEFKGEDKIFLYIKYETDFHMSQLCCPSYAGSAILISSFSGFLSRHVSVWGGSCLLFGFSFSCI